MPPAIHPPIRHTVGRGQIIQGDCCQALDLLPEASCQSIIADPPYFKVLTSEDWDNAWKTEADYMEWTREWVKKARRMLRGDGLLFIFGQLGKREHVWIHLCSLLCREMQFHDMVIWDRVVGYNDRRDSFTPQYEMALVLRQSATAEPYFDKDAVRIPYDEATIQSYLRDKRYKDRTARERHLRKGKYATNILRFPSLKGSSREKIGHPSQKPIELIKALILASSQPGDMIVDPFLGSGTTAAAAEILGRQWIGIEKEAKYVDLSIQRISKINSGAQNGSIGITQRA